MWGGEGRGGREGDREEGRGSRGEGRGEGSGRERVEIINANHLPSICACVIMCTGNELQYAFKLF